METSAAQPLQVFPLADRALAQPSRSRRPRRGRAGACPRQRLESWRLQLHRVAVAQALEDRGALRSLGLSRRPDGPRAGRIGRGPLPAVRVPGAALPVHAHHAQPRGGGQVRRRGKRQPGVLRMDPGDRRPRRPQILRTMMTRRYPLLAPAFLSLTLLPWAGLTAQAKVRVVVTLPNLGSIASEIGGDRIDLTSIAVGTQDAHFVDPKPSYMVKLRGADLLLVNGLDLEIGWVPPLTQGARNPKILLGAPGYIDCSTNVRVVEIPSSLSRAEGDVHPYGNPHYLTDPLNAEAVAGTIAEALKLADPASAQAYEDGRKAFVRKLHEALFGKDLVDLVGGAKL